MLVHLSPKFNIQLERLIFHDVALLPINIIALIIDIVGENNDTDLLKELALVSHSFLHICSKHLFATIDLHDIDMTYNIAYDLQHRIVKKGISQAPRKQAICCQVYPQARVYNRRWSHSITTILNSASFRQQRQSALTHPSKSPRNNSPSQQPQNRRLILGLELSELSSNIGIPSPHASSYH